MNLLIQKTTEGIPMEIWVWLGPLIVIVWLVYAVMNPSDPQYHSETGARVKGGWSTPEKRLRKQRQYNRRKIDECISEGKIEEAEFYEMKLSNSWDLDDYDGRTFKQYKSGMTKEQWNERNNFRLLKKQAPYSDPHFEILEEFMKETLNDKFESTRLSILNNPDADVDINISFEEMTEDKNLINHLKCIHKLSVEGWVNSLIARRQSLI